jgi:hypothetical protein
MTALFKKTLLLLLSLNDNIIINPQISRLVIRKLSLSFLLRGSEQFLSEFGKTMRWEVGRW